MPSSCYLSTGQSLMSLISKQLVPPGGWQYQQGEIWIDGQTADELIGNIRQHRLSNGLPEGDPWQDIQDQICGAHPSTCLGQVVSTPNMITTAFERFRTFAQAMLAFTLSGGETVDQNTANLRAETCVSCHNNVASEKAKGGCASCRSEDIAITNLRKHIIQNKTTASDTKLKTCALCGCDLKLSVWFPLKTLGMNERNINEMPSFCWKKKI